MKNESDVRILRSNSALQHKIVLNDATDTETEDPSFKGDSMLQDDILLTEQERREELDENELAINGGSSSNSSSSSSSSSREG